MNEHPIHSTSTHGTGNHVREELRFRSGDEEYAATLYRPAATGFLASPNGSLRQAWPP